MKRLGLFVFALLALACIWLLLVNPVGASGYGYRSYSYPSYSYSYPSYNYQTVYTYKEIPVYKDVVRIKEVTIPSYAVVPLYSAFYAPQQQPAAPCTTGGHAATVPAATVGAAPAAPGSACAEANAKVDKLQAQVELLVRLLGPAAGGPPPGAAAAGTPPGTSPAATAPPPPPKPKAPAVKEPDDGDQVKATIQTGVNAMYTSCVACHEMKTANTKGNNFVIFDGVNINPKLTERQWFRIEQEVAEGKMPPKTDVDGKPVPPLPAAQKKAIRDFLAMRKSQVARTE